MNNIKLFLSTKLDYFIDITKKFFLNLINY